MIQIEYIKGSKQLQVYNQVEKEGEVFFDFIGQLSLSRLNGNILELDHPIARPRCGNFLYQAAAMMASINNDYLCLPREGDIRDAAMRPFESISKLKRKKKHEIPEDFNEDLYEWTNEEETPILFKAYQVEASDSFKASFRVINTKEESNVPIETLKEWDLFFGRAYESDSNKFIDEDFPVKEDLDFSKIMNNENLKINKEKRQKNKIR